MPHLSPLSWVRIALIVLWRIVCIAVFYKWDMVAEFKYSGRSLGGVKERKWHW